MQPEQESSPLDAISQTIKAELIRRQNEIEQQTGQKPSLEDIFAEMKKDLLGQISSSESEKDEGTPPSYLLKMHGMLPGIRLRSMHVNFIPDLQTISRWKHAANAFYEGYGEDETVQLHKLYIDPYFQRLSMFLEGRMAIIGFLEGTDYKNYPQDQFGNYIEYHNHLVLNLSQKPENYGPIAQDFIHRYGKKYGVNWLVYNEPPLPKIFIEPKGISGGRMLLCWWKYISPILSEEFSVSAFLQVSGLFVQKEMDWMVSLPKFQKLSRTLLGRMDMICAIERCPKEVMMKQLQIENLHLYEYEKHEELIRERFTEMYGMEYGQLWTAYGITGGADYKFAFYAFEKKYRFLDRIPALFRTAKKRTLSENNEHASEENEQEQQRFCLNCGKPIQGRSDKRFCDGGACQRTYYNRHQRCDNSLNGISEQESVEEESSEEKKPEEPKSFLGGLAEILKGPAGTLLNGLANNAADALSEKMFGKKETAPAEEKNSPPPPKVKIVTGEEIMNREFETGFPAFTPEFTKFFGNLHIPFKMLVWGLPGKGKSSFCLKFCNALAIAQLPGTYISAEEDPEGDTMQDKIYLNWRGQLTMKFVTALPKTMEQLHELLLKKDEKGQDKLNSFYIVYDSVSKMEQKPGLADRVQKLFGDNLNEAVSHIYIAHAEKNGSTYQGDAAWEYEVDIVISVESNGIATMRKNRFKTATEGLTGGTFNFFERRIAGR